MSPASPLKLHLLNQSAVTFSLRSMLVAGHETTGSALTWTMYLLAMNPDKMAKAQEEVDRVLSGSKTQPTMADYGELRC